jgi:hypothetical protein
LGFPACSIGKTEKDEFGWLMRPFALIPVGLPAPDCTVPDLQRKSADEIMVCL